MTARIVRTSSMLKVANALTANLLTHLVFRDKRTKQGLHPVRRIRYLVDALRTEWMCSRDPFEMF